MSTMLRFVILAVALVLGCAGAVLAAKVAPVLFWVCWLPALGLVGYFIWSATPCCCAESAETKEPAPASDEPLAPPSAD